MLNYFYSYYFQTVHTTYINIIRVKYKYAAMIMQ